MANKDTIYADTALSDAKLNVLSAFHGATLPTVDFDVDALFLHEATGYVYRNTGTFAVPVWTREIPKQASETTGDILYYNGTTWIRLARGSDNQVLKATATSLEWALPETKTTTYTPANPTAQANLMLGLAMSFTPSISGTVLVFFQCSGKNTSLGAQLNLRLRNGTGTAPVNGAALTGTQFSTDLTLDEPVAGYSIPMTVVALLTGLTVNTAYWFDAVTTASTGTSSIVNIECTIMEMVG